jgi:hypothetical protein
VLFCKGKCRHFADLKEYEEWDDWVRHISFFFQRLHEKKVPTHRFVLRKRESPKDLVLKSNPEQRGGGGGGGGPQIVN